MRLFTPSLKVAIHHTLPHQSRVEGGLSFSGGLLVLGSVQGNLQPEGTKPTLTVGETGVVDVPWVEVDTLIINGRVRANLLKARRVVLGATSNVQADIDAQVVEIHTGAIFEGRVVSRGEAHPTSPTRVEGSAGLARQRLEGLIGAKAGLCETSEA